MTAPAPTSPLLIWPISEPSDPAHIEFLTQKLLPRGSGRSFVFVNECSRRWMNGRYERALRAMEAAGWNVRWIHSVDTCQTWLTAFAVSHAACVSAEVIASCAHTLVPGDFHYRNAEPDLVDTYLTEAAGLLANGASIHIGQIASAATSFKSVVDEFGTWPLLGIWFPHESKLLREKMVHPRSEFLSLSGQYLNRALCERWLPYEQTLVLVLREAMTSTLRRIGLTALGPLQEDSPAEPVGEAMTQVERTERVLRLHWRSSHPHAKADEYNELAVASSAMLQRSFQRLDAALTDRPNRGAAHGKSTW